ncbi:uncharacterized protein METZ01_LOCUS378496, partial [marine metagenome]
MSDTEYEPVCDRLFYAETTMDIAGKSL